MTDYEQISIIIGQLQGLLSRADSMTKNKIGLSKQKIGSLVEDGAYRDSIRIIEKAREINDSNGLGKHGRLVSMANSQIGNWSDLMNKCIMVLPVLRVIERRLRGW